MINRLITLALLVVLALLALPLAVNLDAASRVGDSLARAVDESTSTVDVRYLT